MSTPLTPPARPKPVPFLDAFTRVREPGEKSPSCHYLNRNERLSPLPDWFLEKLRQASDSHVLIDYPVADRAYELLARHENLTPGELLLSAGSDGAIRSIFAAYVPAGGTVVSIDPSYAMYPVYCQMVGARFQAAPFDRDGSFRVEGLLDLIREGVSLVIFANPNQPTGTVMPRADVVRVIEKAASVGALVAVDEAYYHFRQITVIDLVRHYPNLVVTRTFSKAGGLAGARVGYAAGNAEIIANLGKVRSVHDVNAFALRAAEAMLEHPEVMDDYAREVVASGEFLAKSVRELGLDPMATATNFMPIRVAHRCPPAALIAQLEKNGFLVRGPFTAPCLADCIRVTLGPLPLMEAFVAALRKSLADLNA